MADPTVPDHDLLRALLDTTDDAVLTKDLDGVITWWSESAERFYGYPATDAVGRNVVMLVPPDRTQEEEEILARLAAGERLLHYETKRRRQDGEVIDVALNVAPLVGADGVLLGACAVARDITLERLAREITSRTGVIRRLGDQAEGLHSDLADLEIGVDRRINLLARDTTVKRRATIAALIAVVAIAMGGVGYALNRQSDVVDKIRSVQQEQVANGQVSHQILLTIEAATSPQAQGQQAGAIGTAVATLNCDVRRDLADALHAALPATPTCPAIP